MDDRDWPPDDDYGPPPEDTGNQYGGRKTVALAIPGVQGANLSRWATSDQKNTARLSEFPSGEQQAILQHYGLPLDVNPGCVISLGGKPYCETRGLAGLLASRHAIKQFSETKVEVKPCLDQGCVRQVSTGKYKDQNGAIYDKWAKGRYKEIREDDPLPSDRMVIVEVHLELRDGTVIDVHGDACPHNTTSTVRNALIRMASTRAQGRAFRLAVGDPGTVAEELPEVSVQETGETGFGAGAPVATVSVPPATERTDVLRIIILQKELGFTDRDEAVEYCGKVIGKTIHSRSDLTAAQASRVIAALEALQTETQQTQQAAPTERQFDPSTDLFRGDKRWDGKPWIEVPASALHWMTTNAPNGAKAKAQATLEWLESQRQVADQQQYGEPPASTPIPTIPPTTAQPTTQPAQRVNRFSGKNI